MKLGEKIKRRRKERKLSQGDLAQRVGINPTHLSRLEGGKYQPSVEVLKKLADELEVSTDYLLSEDTTEAPEVTISNKSLAERIRLIDSLDEPDQQALIQVIDSMLTKHKLRRFLDESPATTS